RIFMALAREEAKPIEEIMRSIPEIRPDCQWAIFLRNHDELTLEMVTDEERSFMYAVYAKDPRMKVNVGIRRRLAPLVDGGRRQLELLHSILLTLPGSPILYYGDEIGMGDNIYLDDRHGVRTPMQWSIDRNAGFSQADTAKLYSPVIVDPPYAYQGVNVEAQERSAYSLLQWVRQVIRVRKQYPVFGRGSLAFLTPNNPKILAYLRSYEGMQVLVVHNLSRYAQPVALDLSPWKGFTPVEMIGQVAFPPIGEQPYLLTLGPHAFFWFRLDQSS
ncbi:MAG: alpha-glucosidase C-terminal domain-containing protein, partial [Meiothermus silvanus]|nr:alpha-glucosidase C-terminal domain-containing protein [Allomeiothermus silvanus]